MLLGYSERETKYARFGSIFLRIYWVLPSFQRFFLAIVTVSY